MICIDGRLNLTDSVMTVALTLHCVSDDLWQKWSHSWNLRPVCTKFCRNSPHFWKNHKFLLQSNLDECNMCLAL